MFSEIFTDDLAVYTVVPREITDDTALYKFQRDRQKKRKFIQELLKHNEIMIFYIEEEDGLEKFVVATLKNIDVDAFDLPEAIDEWRNNTYQVKHHVPFISVPDKTPFYIHVDDITKIVLRNENIQEVTKNLKLW